MIDHRSQTEPHRQTSTRWLLAFTCLALCMLDLSQALTAGYRIGSGRGSNVLQSPYFRRICTSLLEQLSNTDGDSISEDENNSVNIPSEGISISDEIEASQKERFVTEVVPIKDLPGVAQLVTSSVTTASFEPVRYLVALSPPSFDEKEDDSQEEQVMPEGTDFCLVDIPPFSPQLATRIKAYIGPSNKIITAIITSRDAIHYDDAPAVYSTRRPDLDLWLKAFPELTIVGYRLDTPRDCRHAVSQVLDGYGPFALDEDNDNKPTFVETGRPLIRQEWDMETREKVLSGESLPSDDVPGDEDDYSPEAIRSREEGRRLLAIYTPGHSFGSVSYVFPETRVCCSGFTIPVEDTRGESESASSSPGPALDCRGYISKSRAGISRQMESAEALIDTYVDRFDVVLPSRGDPLFLDDLRVDERKRSLKQILSQYKRIGEIYQELGILPNNE